jgi:hypothetical protein
MRSGTHVVLQSPHEIEVVVHAADRTTGKLPGLLPIVLPARRLPGKATQAHRCRAKPQVKDS